MQVMRCIFLGLFIGLVLTAPVRAADWPQQPVTVVVPFGAGGNTDTMARMVTQRLQERLGQPFVIDNRGGAGGAIAMGQIARAPADGYTLVFAASPQIEVVPLLRQVNYDPIKDFVPISVFGAGPFVLGIQKTIPAQNLQEFIAYAKQHGGKINYGSGGPGTVAHLAGAMFSQRAGFEATHIPYKGGGQAVGDLIAGQTEMYFGNASELVQANGTGKVTIIAVSSEQRMAQFPGVPTISETMPDFVLTSWNGFMAPAGLPKPIVELLAKEVAEIAREPEVQKRLFDLGIKPVGNTPSEFAATIKKEMPFFAAAVKAAGIGAQ
jgi:tripartite-type tricarboxylate transporter receptor subunit TctC